MLGLRTISDWYQAHFIASLYEREKGIIGRQRIVIFSHLSILLLLGVILNLCGMAGPVSPFFQGANILQGLLSVLAVYLYYSRRISLVAALSFFCLVLQIELSAETVYSAFNKSEYDVALIIANMSLSSVVLLLAVITYLRIVPYLIVVLSLSSYTLSIYITESATLANFFLVFFIIFVALSLLGHSMIHNISSLDRENAELRDEQQELLSAFNLTREEMNSYMALAREKKLEPEKTAEILANVGNAAKTHIVNNIAHYIRQSSIEFDKLNERLPELTPSELEICALILKEKKLKEIVELLGKSRGNITCQRTNIRAKLGMQPGDNLLEVLKKRMEPKEKKSLFHKG